MKNILVVMLSLSALIACQQMPVNSIFSDKILPKKHLESGQSPFNSRSSPIGNNGEARQEISEPKSLSRCAVLSAIRFHILSQPAYPRCQPPWENNRTKLRAGDKHST